MQKKIYNQKHLIGWALLVIVFMTAFYFIHEIVSVSYGFANFFGKETIEASAHNALVTSLIWTGLSLLVLLVIVYFVFSFLLESKAAVKLSLLLFLVPFLLSAYYISVRHAQYLKEEKSKNTLSLNTYFTSKNHAS